MANARGSSFPTHLSKKNISFATLRWAASTPSNRSAATTRRSAMSKSSAISSGVSPAAHLARSRRVGTPSTEGAPNLTRGSIMTGEPRPRDMPTHGQADLFVVFELLETTDDVGPSRCPLPLTSRSLPLPFFLPITSMQSSQSFLPSVLKRYCANGKSASKCLRIYSRVSRIAHKGTPASRAAATTPASSIS